MKPISSFSKWIKSESSDWFKILLSITCIVFVLGLIIRATNTPDYRYHEEYVVTSVGQCVERSSSKISCEVRVRETDNGELSNESVESYSVIPEGKKVYKLCWINVDEHRCYTTLQTSKKYYSERYSDTYREAREKFNKFKEEEL